MQVKSTELILKNKKTKIVLGIVGLLLLIFLICFFLINKQSGKELYNYKLEGKQGNIVYQNSKITVSRDGVLVFNHGDFTQIEPLLFQKGKHTAVFTIKDTSTGNVYEIDRYEHIATKEFKIWRLGSLKEQLHDNEKDFFRHGNELIIEYFYQESEESVKSPTQEIYIKLE